MIKFSIKHRGFFFLGALASLAVTFNACTDVDNTLGDDFIDPSQRNGVLIDSTFAIDAYTVSTDSVATSTTSGKSYIGSYNDPVFGQINSSVATQFYPSSLSDYKKYAKNVSDRIDSLVLNLKLKGGVGDSLAIQHLKVFQMKNKIHSDTLYYYSNYRIKDSIETEEISVNKNFDKSSISYSRKGDGVVHIKLSKDFVNKLFNSNIDTAKISSYEIFMSTFKSLYIENAALSSGGGLNAIDFSDTTTRMHLYFKVAGVVNKDSIVRMPFFVGSTSYSSVRRFSIIQHVYNGNSLYAVKPGEINPDLSKNPTPSKLVYLQGFGGLRTLVKFNDASVKSWLELHKDAKIYRAELIVEPYFPGNLLNYKNMPMSMTAYYSKTVSGKKYMYFIDDMVTFKGVSTNAFYNRSRRLYSLNITTHFKDAMRGVKPKEFYLYAGVPSGLYSSSSSSYGTNYVELPYDFWNVPNQVILGADPNKAPKNPIRLVITYSK
ncbi:DUF4270 family protein [uncultured Acetobacteroides sp.]|uniref:DUF4270 family protein n=1 Tax=uncultured Acetobacteroides sp. TaxID=1760811 RepID=UPI0029F57C69|nr:DUF4270 family protein [uncultured Acetobacteroides sp.]